MLQNPGGRLALRLLCIGCYGVCIQRRQIDMKAAPGLNRCAAPSPISNANVEIDSKYNNAFPLTRPTCLIFFMPAIPETTVQNTTGPMIILISLIKASLNGFIWTANSGAIVPSTMPMTIAKSTCMYKVLASFFMTFLKKKSIVAVIEFGARRNLWDYPRSTRCKYLKTLKKLALTSRKPKQYLLSCAKCMTLQM